MLLLRTEKDEENVSESLHLVFLIKWILLYDIKHILQDVLEPNQGH